MSSRQLPPFDTIRYAVLNQYTDGLSQILQKQRVFDTLGPTTHANLCSALGRITLARLTSAGSIEVSPDTAPDAIAILPVLRGEQPETWRIGDSITQALSTAGLATIHAKDLRLSPHLDFEPFVREGDKKPYDWSYAGPDAPRSRRDAVGQVLGGNHIVADNSYEYFLQSRPLITVCNVLGKARKAALLAHELSHVIFQEQGELTPYMPSAKQFQIKCDDEARALITESAIARGASTMGKITDMFMRDELGESVRRARKIRAWQNKASLTGDMRYFTANMILHGLYKPSAAFISQLPPDERHLLTLPV